MSARSGSCPGLRSHWLRTPPQTPHRGLLPRPRISGTVHNAALAKSASSYRRILDGVIAATTASHGNDVAPSGHTLVGMGENRRMPPPNPLPGLRERKKIRTRAAIRRAAFRLIDQQGYASTTVEQIAEAADVAPRTFSRYFPAKEAVLLSDDLIEPIVDAFIAAPSDLSPIAAYRHAVTATFSAMTDAERDDAVAGQRLMYTVPEARGLLYTEYIRLIALITDALATRLRQPTDEFERRMIAGAIVGVLIASSDGTPMPDDPLSQGLTFLDSVMRLR